jgi:hypothetical protein
MSRKEYEHLLSDVLGDATVEQFRQNSLSRSLHRLRRRKRIKAAAQVCGVAMLLLVPAWLMFRDNEATPSVATSVPVIHSAAVSVQEPTSPRIEEITDKELLSLFPERTVALIGPPGMQQLLVLGNVGTKSPAPLPFPDSHRRL